MNQLSGPLLVTLGSIIISFSPVLVRVASVGPTMAGFYRSLIGGLVLLGLAWAKGGSLGRGGTVWALAGLSAVVFALDLSFWHRSIHAVGPGLATILTNFQVFFLAALGMIFLGERLGPRLLMAMPLAIAGIALLVGLDRFQVDRDFRIGVIFALCAALAYALYVLSLRKLQADQEASKRLANFALVSLMSALFMGVEGWAQGESFIIPDLKSWLAMIAYGVFCQALGWLLISTGLPRMAASRAGLLLLLQPTAAFLWDILFFGRPTTGLEYMGAALALIAIYLGGAKK
jgi:drug/metabolite transporter (DMT)-like permease